MVPFRCSVDTCAHPRLKAAVEHYLSAEGQRFVSPQVTQPPQEHPDAAFLQSIEAMVIGGAISLSAGLRLAWDCGRSAS